MLQKIHIKSTYYFYNFLKKIIFMNTILPHSCNLHLL